MEITKRELTAICISFVLILAFMGGVTLYVVDVNNRVVAEYNDLVEEYNKIIESLQGENTGQIDYVMEIHSRVRMWKAGVLIFDEYNAGVATDRGDNMTLFKMFGNTDLDNADLPYTDNCTFISIGNDTGTLATTVTVLPNEWNRTASTVGGANEYGQSWLNMTCTMYPSAGPQTADCIGLNLNATLGANNLCFYDTFTQVTGIDETFTIVIEFKISESHA